MYKVSAPAQAGALGGPTVVEKGLLQNKKEPPMVRVNIKQIFGNVNREIPSFLKNFDKRKGRGRKFDSRIRDFFLYILDIATSGTTFEICPSEVASRFGVTGRTIRNWLAFFVRNHWIIPVDRKGGKGRHSKFYLYWGTQFRNPERRNHDNNNNRTVPEGESQGYKKRVEILRFLPDDLTLKKGKAYYRWVMESFRKTIFKACPWSSRRTSEVICDFLGRKIAGKSMETARSLVRWLCKNVHTIVLAVAEALERGTKDAFRCMWRLLYASGC